MWKSHTHRLTHTHTNNSRAVPQSLTHTHTLESYTLDGSPICCCCCRLLLTIYRKEEASANSRMRLFFYDKQSLLVVGIWGFLFGQLCRYASKSTAMLRPCLGASNCVALSYIHTYIYLCKWKPVLWCVLVFVLAESTLLPFRYIYLLFLNSIQMCLEIVQWSRHRSFSSPATNSSCVYSKNIIIHSHLCTYIYIHMLSVS